MSLFDFLRRPQHCTTCGDEFVQATYRDGFRRSDGSPIMRSWWKCPRSGDADPFPGDRWQVGRCSGLPPFACAVQVAAYRDHRPSHRACTHHSVSQDGDKCWTKDRRLITDAHRLVAA